MSVPRVMLGGVGTRSVSPVFVGRADELHVLHDALARAAGWAELAAAQELVRGLPPSRVHAEVLTMIAGWSMVHAPGPEALLDAQRAVEYARMVGAGDTELNARLTLGSLMVDAGDVEEGLAAMYAVRDEAVERSLTALVGRSHVNLPSCLDGVGRAREAAEVLREGLEHTRRLGLPETEAFVRSNLAESLFALGRWDEAVESASKAATLARSAKPRGSGCLHLASLALARGDAGEAARLLADARGHYGTHDLVPQYAIPLTGLTIGVAAAEGRIPGARAALQRALDTGFPPGTQRYAWPLLLTAVTAEADARGLPAAEEGRAEILGRVATVLRRLPTGAPVWRAHEAWVRAELLRAGGVPAPEPWSAAVTAFEPLERPYDLARVRHRLAEALPASGADEEGRDRAAELLRQAAAVAGHLRARPLADEVARLARRARLPLARPPGTPSPAAADPVEALGLTGREQDVLRLVAEGRSNRGIAEELFISPKTASVHVSNILAKLGVSGRGEAAAMAHRLRMFSRTP
ncbi:hypothetical protein GCM10010145_45300 [Streptomyces ruber]|uniref:HTH luxR-type domain-containing protein n=1 Tax=Streptomyces ruber TaxID=83378 RepID=A0A918BI66_9ACTN|nr:hypothetical protein GCM10010145_45300 [Streptomyces ruber]